MKQIDITYNKQDDIQFFLDDDREMSWLGEFDTQGYQRIFVLMDKNVYIHWGETIQRELGRHEKEVFILEIEANEKNKSLQYYPKVVGFLENNMCNRYDLVVAVGGGIVLDIASFTISTYMRGVPFFMVPTTLIGQMDASTAGKTCLNTDGSKNLLGTFYYPLKVYNNIHFLETSDPYYLRQGYSEIFKYGLLDSRELIEKLRSYQKEASPKLLLEILELSINSRSAIPQKDPLASNLGHTFGNAIERASNYDICHGDAINAGTVLALNFAREEGLIEQSAVDEIVGVMKELGLNLYIQKGLNIEQFVHAMLKDKKSSATELNLVLVKGVEKPYENDGQRFYQTSPDRVDRFLSNFLKQYPYCVEDCAKLLKTDKLRY